MSAASGHAAIQTQLIWNRLLAIVEEQAQTLMRTAFSPVVREAGDLSAGVFDARGAMLAQAVTGTPGHVNAMAAAVGKFLAKHPLRSLAPGDVLLTNDPWHATGHLNDFTVVTPVFLGERAIALFASTSHIADVGGRGFGPDANQVFEEGLNIPIGHLFRAGALNETLMEIVRANVRDPLAAEGDLHSLAACNATGAAQLLALLADFGLRSLDAVGAAVLASSERAMREEIAGVPNGTYRQAMTVDGYDDPVELVCAVTVGDADIQVDFDGSSGPSAHGVNVPLNYTEAYAAFGVRCVVGNDVPNNAGSLAAIRVTAPAGSILNAQRPAAVSARHALGQLVPDVVLGCLEQALPGHAPAEGAACIWNPVLLSTTGAKAPFVANPIFNGGAGARPAKDGLSATAFPSGVRATPVEVNEATAPLVIWRKEYITDSGGAGERRGGLGQIVEIAHADGEPFEASKMFERIRHPARGRHGGAAGRAGEVYVRAAGGAGGRTRLRAKGKETVPADGVLVFETPGGGGIGDPRRRDPAAVQADVHAELVSVSAARAVYGQEAAEPGQDAGVSGQGRGANEQGVGANR